MFFDPRYPDVPIPDALDLVVEAFDLGTVFAAHRLERVDDLRVEALADAARRGRALTDVVERGIRLELAAALRITERAADAMIILAEGVVRRYPAVLESMRGARMTERHAEILVAGLDEVEPDLREGLVGEAVALAETTAVGTFRRSLRRLIDDARAVTLAERHASAVQKRRLCVETAEDGMGWLMLYAPLVEVHAIHDRVTRMARVLVDREGDERTLDQARADVASDLLVEGRAPSHPAEAGGVRARVVLTVPALALLSRDDRERDAAGHAPAVIDGVGPIPLERARDLVGTATGMMRVLTHPETGVVVSVGRTRYRPPPELRALARWRSARCMAPGCAVPADRCDLDHHVAWEDGGDTSLANLSPLCRGHHMVKHHGGWNIHARPDGSVEWMSPAGRRYLVQPERRTPVFHTTHDDTAPPF